MVPDFTLPPVPHCCFSFVAHACSTSSETGMPWTTETVLPPRPLLSRCTLIIPSSFIPGGALALPRLLFFLPFFCFRRSPSSVEYTNSSSIVLPPCTENRLNDSIAQQF